MRIKITIEEIPEDQYDEKQGKGTMVLDVSGEGDIFNWIDVIEKILRFVGFTDKTIDELFEDIQLHNL